MKLILYSFNIRHHRFPKRQVHKNFTIFINTLQYFWIQYTDIKKCLRTSDSSLFKRYKALIETLKKRMSCYECSCFLLEAICSNFLAKTASPFSSLITLSKARIDAFQIRQAFQVHIQSLKAFAFHT